MRPQAFATSFENHAPRFLGAVFCALLVAFNSACDKKGTPDWEMPGGKAPTATASPAPVAPPDGVAKVDSNEFEPPLADDPHDALTSAAISTSSPTSEGLRFIAYNVIGGFIWIYSFIYLGYFFGNLPVIKKNFGLVIVAIIILSVVPIVVEFFREWRKSRSTA